MNQVFQSRISAEASAGHDPRGAEILILTGYYHPEPTGSAPPISDLSYWLAENGARTRVLTTRPSYPRSEVTAGYRLGERDHETVNGVRVHRLPADIAPNRGMLGRFKTEFSLLLRMWAAKLAGSVKSSPYVICVCPSIFVVAAVGLFLKRGGRSLCIVHDIQSGLGSSLGFTSAGLLLGILRRLEAWALNRCHVIVALSDEMAEEVRGLGVKRPIVVIPPQVDVRELGGLPEPAADVPALLYSGNLGRKQGLDQVLALARTLLARGVRARVIIRGEGSERAELCRQVAEEKLENVVFQDLVSRETLREAFAEGVIHLVPQHPNGATFAVPSKLFSIMAAERPFLATAAPNSPIAKTTKASGGGLCVEPYNTDALADAAEDLLRNPALRRRMGAAGREYVERYVDREVACRRIWSALQAGAPAREFRAAWALNRARSGST
ncbi:glycosyltransferase family 4 protein [Phenylobacterium sp.]|uniref:glycosyltransferase family 4 protein n=1 Tax=Phenylobacterium sp. TaxID=1871053 RepID=UPI002F3FFBE7